MTLGLVITFSAVLGVAAFLLFRGYAAREKKLWLTAGIIAACLCLAGLGYMVAALLLIAAIA